MVLVYTISLSMFATAYEKRGSFSTYADRACINHPFSAKVIILSRRAKVVDASPLYPYNSKNQSPNNFRVVSVNKQTVNNFRVVSVNKQTVNISIFSVPYSVCQ